MNRMLSGTRVAIRSERRRAEAHGNPAYRWFCKLGVEDGIPTIRIAVPLSRQTVVLGRVRS